MNQDLDELKKKCVNLIDYSDEERVEFLIQLYLKNNLEFEEIIATIISLYLYSKISSIKNYILKISDSKLPIIYKIDIIKYIVIKEKELVLNKLLSYTEEPEIFKLDFPVKIDFIIYVINLINEKKEEDMMSILVLSSISAEKNKDKDKDEEKSRNEDKKQKNEKCFIFFQKLLDDKTIKDYEKLKHIQSMKNNINKDSYFFIEKCLEYFINNNSTDIRYVILGCQSYINILSKIDFTAIKLLEIANNTEYSEDIRADACDILITSKINVKEAESILKLLGGSKNIYENSQNIHELINENSMNKAINILKSNSDEISFETIRKNMNNTELDSVFERISIDTTKYNKIFTLQDILKFVYSYIINSEFKEELLKRLTEELIESTNKCSTGIVGRLLNSLSGFDSKLSFLSVDIEKQIYSSFSGRFNKLIKNSPDQEKILEEITIESKYPEKRKHFLLFFRKSIPDINNELYNEFVFGMNVDPSDFDMWFRNAIIKYES
jgi:hypothetical protein